MRLKIFALAFFAVLVSFSALADAACSRDSDCDCRNGGAQVCDSSNPFGHCIQASGTCVYCTDGLDNDRSGFRDCQEPNFCPASRFVNCGSGEYASCRAGESSYGRSSSLKWTAGWQCQSVATPRPPTPTVAPTLAPGSCSLSVSPPSVVAGENGRVEATVNYANLDSQPDSVIISCGNGRFSTARNCLGVSGSCSAYCYYPYSGEFRASATAGFEDCGSQTIFATTPAPSCGNSVCESGETKENCPADCGVPYFCGDGICTNGETASNCATDCGSPAVTCSDGTLENQCSLEKPLYCDFGILVERATLCGCPQGQIRQGESCASAAICSDGTAANSCSANKPYYCDSASALQKNASSCGCPQETVQSGNDCISPSSCAFLDVSLDQSRTVEKGSAASYLISLHNNGQSQINAILSASSPTADLQFDYSQTQLLPNETKNIVLTAFTQNTPEGTYSIPLEISTSGCKNNYALSLQVTPANETPEYNQSCCQPLSKFHASITPSAIQFLRPGETAKYNILLQNDNPEHLFAELSTIDNALEKSTIIQENGVRVDAESSKIVQATVTAPAGTPGGVYDVLFSAKLAAPCCTKNIPLPAKISVFAPTASLQIFKEPTPACPPISHGVAYSFEIGIKNTGETTGNYRVSLIQPPSVRDAIQPSQNLLELKPGETSYFNITISPSALVPEGQYAYTLEADYNQFVLLKRDYCFQVRPVSAIAITPPAQITISPNTTASFEFEIENQGTATENFSIEAQQVQGLTASFEPSSVRLAPREKKTISMILRASANADFGKRFIPITARSSRTTLSETFIADVAKPPQPAQFDNQIAIAAPSFKVVEGIASFHSVQITNNKNATLQNLALTLQGIPSAWYQADAPRDLQAGQTAEFRVRINATQNSAQLYDVTVRAENNQSYATANSTLFISRQKTAIDYTFTQANVTENNAISEVILTLTVKNNGNLPATSIKPALPQDAQDFVITSEPSALSLAPGESQQMKITLRPASADATASQSIPIKLKSANGAERLQPIQVPGMQAQKTATAKIEFPWKIIAIIVLLVLIFAIMAREYPKNPQQPQKPYD